LSSDANARSSGGVGIGFVAALQNGAVIRREGDFYGKYRLENRAIVRFFDDEEPDHGYEKNSFRVDEILADDWVVEPKR